MKANGKQLLSFFCTLIIMICRLPAQQNQQGNFYEAIKKYDLSEVLKPGGGPIGFIDTTHYQRFYIHFSSITRRKGFPYIYDVKGKTRVMKNICSFEGSIQVLGASIDSAGDVPSYMQGSLSCKLEFFEDKTQPSTGMFKGTYDSDFYIDSLGKIAYNNLMSGADGFDNNDFTGTWTSYKTHVSLTCCWGDYRIPHSQLLDQGVGEFIPSDPYLKYGWQTYRDVVSGDPQSPVVKLSQTEENREWWK
jgi:hypothetical protein